MALNCTLLTSLTDAVDRTSYGIPSASPPNYTAGNLYVLFFSHTKGSTPDIETSISTSVATVSWSKPATSTVLSHEIAAPETRLTVAIGVCTASGTGGTTTVSFSATQTGFIGAIIEVTGSGTLALVGDAAVNAVDNVNASSVGITVTKTATTGNILIAGFDMDANATLTPDTFTELFDNGRGTPADLLEVCWLLNGSNPRVTGPSTTRDLGGIAVEIQENAGAAAGVPYHPWPQRGPVLAQ